MFHIFDIVNKSHKKIKNNSGLVRLSIYPNFPHLAPNSLVLLYYIGMTYSYVWLTDVLELYDTKE